MFGYAKISPGEDKNETILLFQEFNCEKVVIDDSHNPKSSGGVWDNLKSDILESKDRVLVVDSLFSLGKTGREIFRELEWITVNKIVLYIISVPTSFESDEISTKLLWELYNDKACRERKNVAYRQKEGQDIAMDTNVRFGRPATAYPENWEEDFDAWKNKQLTTAEFMERTKLKKGTFYNLIKRYKKSLNIKDLEIDDAG